MRWPILAVFFTFVVQGVAAADLENYVLIDLATTRDTIFKSTHWTHRPGGSTWTRKPKMVAMGGRKHYWITVRHHDCESCSDMTQTYELDKQEWKVLLRKWNDRQPGEDILVRIQ